MNKRLELFDKLIANGTSDPFHFYARAMELRSLERKAEALEAFVDLTKRFADYVPSYLMAAQLAQEAGDSGKARALASAGIEAAHKAGDEHAASELTALRDTLSA
jgi:plasmid replication initiation protein